MMKGQGPIAGVVVVGIIILYLAASWYSNWQECEGKLKVCADNSNALTGENQRLTTELGTCTSDLTSCRGNLAETNNSLNMCRDNLSDCENNLDRCKNRVCNPEILTKTEYKYLLAGAGLWGFISLLITFFTSADQMQKNSKDDWNTFLNILVVIIAVLGFIGL